MIQLRVMQDRNLALEVVRITEAAAIASARLMGKGDRKQADHVAVEAMRSAFDAIDTLHLVVPAMAKTLATAVFRIDRMKAATANDFSTATDLADYLVRTGLPFREAHEIVGQIVRHCIETGASLETLDAPALASFSPHLAGDPQSAVAQLTVEASVRTRKSRGGTAPEAVRAQRDLANQKLDRPVAEG